MAALPGDGVKDLQTERSVCLQASRRYFHVAPISTHLGPIIRLSPQIRANPSEREGSSGGEPLCSISLRPWSPSLSLGLSQSLDLFPLALCSSVPPLEPLTSSLMSQPRTWEQ